MISYRDSPNDIRPSQLLGFFEGWPEHPTPERHLELLCGSSYVILALERDSVVGYVTAVSDGVLAAYIPFLEVLPSHRGRGIGSELMRRMMAKLEHLYMIDLVCDKERRQFYERLGMKPAPAMIVRRRERQSGAE